MKKTILIAIAIATLCGGRVCAQTFAVHAGYNNSLLLYIEHQTANDKTTTNKQGEDLNGVYLGGSLNIEFSHGLGLEPGAELLYTSRKEDDNQWDALHLIVPIYLNYTFDFSDIASLRVLLGPTVNIGLLNDISDQASPLYKRYSNTKRLGVELSGGLQLTFAYHWGVDFRYQIGLLNMIDDSHLDDNTTANCTSNRLTVGLSYMF